MNLYNVKMSRQKALQLLVGHVEFTGNRLHEHQFTELMEKNNIIYVDILKQLKPETLVSLLERHFYSEFNQQ